MEWFLKVLRQYADFEGRARRKEFWMFTLFYCIFNVVAGIIDGLLGFRVGIFGGILALGLLIPSLAVSVRRLHDIGKSGWWLFLLLIPVIGWIIIFVWDCQDSQPGENQYGPNPKETGVEMNSDRNSR
ncbi:MAG: DUF805 domain-containing protein [Prevotellaceae bacterium]|jgi:uncharacterized membrane protein YhaH (DUF805 family)|nr:DUF805 domain-containing protein [Prevotellaceae bacterium]